MPKAEINPEVPVIDSKMAMCINCGQPIVSVMGEDYGHAMTGKPDCEPDPRLDPPT